MPETLLRTLIGIGLVDNEAIQIASGAMWFEDQGGTSISTYLQDANNIDSRDELMLFSNLMFAVSDVLRKDSGDDEFLKFSVAYLYFLKLNAMSVSAIDSLLSKKCYPDAFSVCRSMHARANLILLISFRPSLFDDWLANPKESCYLEGHIRNELEKHGLCTMGHLYDIASELIHNQHLAGLDIGYFEKGLFPEIPAISNQVCVYAKFVIASIAFAGIQFGLNTSVKQEVEIVLQEYDRTFNKLARTYLSPGRTENFFVSIAEDRHWEKVGKGRYQAGGLFSFEAYSTALQKFRSKKGGGQRKTLGKEYTRRVES